jgi:hypothetical protein
MGSLDPHAGAHVHSGVYPFGAGYALGKRVNCHSLGQAISQAGAVLGPCQGIEFSWRQGANAWHSNGEIGFTAERCQARSGR